MERERIVDQEGMLYNQFNTITDFELIEKYARVRSFLLMILICFSMFP